MAAVTGLAAGLVEYLLVTIGGSAKGLVDVAVGTSTGAIAGLFYRYGGQNTCMPAIFLGTLYWFFYGTAFVLGILEIISGELETGVVRFMAVGVKTFVLTLGTTFGMQMTLDNSLEAWQDPGNVNCGRINLDEHWWRIPLYLLCSASTLGQYRMPINVYWRGLTVQLVGYEVQYQLFKAFEKRHNKDFLDTAAANACGAIAAVAAASLLSTLVDSLSYYYNARVLQRHQGKFSRLGEFMFSLNVFYIRLSNKLGFGKQNDVVFLKMTETLKKHSEELNDVNHHRSKIELSKEEESALLEAVIEAEDLNIWALLMPTVYQLVPGSLIAKMWFNAVFPLPLESEERKIEGTDYTYISEFPNQQEESVFQNLMVVAASLAIGLLIGFGLVEGATFLLKKIFDGCGSFAFDPTDSVRYTMMNKRSRLNADYTNAEDDPLSDDDEDDSEDFVLRDVEVGGAVSPSDTGDPSGFDKISANLGTTINNDVGKADDALGGGETSPLKIE